MGKNFYERLQAIKLNIGFYRKKNGLTQVQLAEKLNISRTHLSNIEAKNMETRLTLELLYEIADALNVEIEKLLEAR